MQIQHLSFDSELFGYPVGKIQVTDIWDEEVFLELAKDFKLVYLFSAKPLEISDSRIIWLNKNLLFKKGIEVQTDCEKQAFSLNDDVIHPDIYSLAFQSGEFSRFNKDPRLEANEFKKLYFKWIEKEVEESHVLALKDFSGMVTFSEKDEIAKIGLLAVDRSQRNSGLGSALMKEAESAIFRLGAKEVQVQTQDINQAACTLYSKLGYEIEREEFVYHFVK